MANQPLDVAITDITAYDESWDHRREGVACIALLVGPNKERKSQIIDGLRPHPILDFENDDDNEEEEDDDDDEEEEDDDDEYENKEEEEEEEAGGREDEEEMGRMRAEKAKNNFAWELD
jgi:hypothetical protein